MLNVMVKYLPKGEVLAYVGRIHNLKEARFAKCRPLIWFNGLLAGRLPAFRLVGSDWLLAVVTPAGSSRIELGRRTLGLATINPGECGGEPAGNRGNTKCS